MQVTVNLKVLEWAFCYARNTQGEILRKFPMCEKWLTELTKWVRNLEKRPHEQFILKAKNNHIVLEYYKQIAERVYNDSKFKERHKQIFLSKADPWIIAAAKAWGDTVETFEKMPESNSTKVKIPDICKRMGVPCINLYEMMRKIGMVLNC